MAFVIQLPVQYRIHEAQCAHGGRIDQERLLRALYAGTYGAVYHILLRGLLPLVANSLSGRRGFYGYYSAAKYSPATLFKVRATSKSSKNLLLQKTR